MHPLLLTDWDVRRQNWRLLEHSRAGAIELPPVGGGPGAADAIGTPTSSASGEGGSCAIAWQRLALAQYHIYSDMATAFWVASRG